MPPHSVLMTGATGFLGRELLRRLLDDDPALELDLLIRARDEAQLARRRDRLADFLGPERARRMRAVRGDIASERLGLDERDYDALVERLERVVHVAASVSFDQAIEQARRTNVGGTEQAIALCRRLARAGRSGRLDYVGTAYVAGDRTDTVYEDELERGQGFRNTYEQSKYEAEQRCRAAQGELPIAIHRPSIIVGDSRTGQTTSFKTIYWPMKVITTFYGLWRPVLPRLVRLPVSPACPLDLVPVNWVAEAVARLYRDPGAAGHAYHLAAGPGAERIDHLVNLACDHFGVARLRYLDPAGPVRVVARAVRPVAGILAPRFARNAELILAYATQNPRFDVTRARAAGLVAPPITDYYLRLVGFAYGTDYGRGSAAQ